VAPPPESSAYRGALTLMTPIWSRPVEVNSMNMMMLITMSR
jgi:hypothetical protein